MSSISAISPSSSAQNVMALQSLRTDAAESGVNASKSASADRDPAAIKKVASQFEAIILRQLLAPSIEPVMSGGLDGGQSTGGSIYGYMLTDTLANSMAQGGGFGLSRVIEKQFTPHGAKADIYGGGKTPTQS